jgi:serine phosphatase RsbU (regulator of sigma subunit)
MTAKSIMNTQPSIAVVQKASQLFDQAFWVHLRWGLCVGLTLATLTLYALAAPLRWNELNTVVMTGPRGYLQLMVPDAVALAQLGITPSMYASLLLTLETGLLLCFVFFAGLMMWRKPADGMGLYFAITGITYAAFTTTPLDSLLALSSPLAIQSRLLQALGIWCTVTFFFVFPDGRFTIRWTRYVAIALAIWCISTVVYPIPLLDPMNPLRLPLPGTILHLSWFVFGLIAQSQRFRQTTDPMQRLQTRWVVLSTASAVILYVILYLPPFVWPDLRAAGWPRLIYDLTIHSIYVLSLYAIPVSIFFAVLRYGLWDLDLLINRALVYGVLTATLVLIYFGIVIGLPTFFPFIPGFSSSLTISLATLFTAALATPVRRRVQSYIDYRFFRSQYDAARTLAAFGAAVRDEIDMDQLMAHLKTVVAETLAPESIACWVRSGVGYQHCPGAGQNNAAYIGENDPLVARLHQLGIVVDFATLAAGLPVIDELRHQKVALVAPMISRGELIGWLSLGARRSGSKYAASDRRLLAALAAQAAPALRVAQLVQEQRVAAVERELVAHELYLAHTVQQALLPKSMPALDGWVVTTHFQPAREVGGDFYDFLPFADGMIGLVVGDVTGKGVPSALLMASTRSLIRSVARQYHTPAAILREVNNLLDQEMPMGMFVTCLVALLDPRTGWLRFANAGHTLPLHRSAGQTQELRATGTPLGIFPDQEYDEVAVQLAHGDALLFYSDGISEAHGPGRVMYGTARLAEVVKRQQPGAAGALVGALLEDLRTFAGDGQQQEDDVTLVVLERD